MLTIGIRCLLVEVNVHVNVIHQNSQAIHFSKKLKNEHLATVTSRMLISILYSALKPAVMEIMFMLLFLAENFSVIEFTLEKSHYNSDLL